MRSISLLLFILLAAPASADTKCVSGTRCHEYQKCIWNGQIDQCSKGSSSSVSFGIGFKSGDEVFVEWIYNDKARKPIELYDHGYALVNGTKTKYWNTDPDCIEFEAIDKNPSFGYGECSSGKLVNLFSCNLPPYDFNVLRKGDQNDKDWVAIRQGTYSQEYAQATFITDGSGVCRKAIWSFDHNGPMSISTLGCYGEVVPPEDAVGEIAIGEGDFKNSFYCY